MSKITPEERAKRVEAARYARGTMGLVEGYRPSQLTQELQALWIEGELSIDEAIEAAIARYRQP